MYLINGQYPGPTLNATEGDTVTVYVTNMMAPEGLSIHWHGIRQINTNLMDGGSQITQCVIQPFETFAYTFVVDKVRSGGRAYDENVPLSETWLEQFYSATRSLT